MKKALIIGGIALAIIGLIVFSKMTSKKNAVSTYAEVKKGIFEIIVSNSGELIAEKSIDIMGPTIAQAIDQVGNQGGGGRQGGGGSLLFHHQPDACQRFPVPWRRQRLHRS